MLAMLNFLASLTKEPAPRTATCVLESPFNFSAPLKKSAVLPSGNKFFPNPLAPLDNQLLAFTTSATLSILFNNPILFPALAINPIPRANVLTAAGPVAAEAYPPLA